MSYTTPTAKTAGQNLTVADWNTSVRGNLEALAKRPACVAERNSSQTLSTGDAIAFNDTDRVDTHTMHDTSTNNTRITIPADWGGIWFVAASSQATALHLLVNGTAVRARGGYSVSALIPLTAADYVEAVAGNAASITSAQMSAIWMRATP